MLDVTASYGTSLYFIAFFEVTMFWVLAKISGKIQAIDTASQNRLNRNTIKNHEIWILLCKVENHMTEFSNSLGRNFEKLNDWPKN